MDLYCYSADIQQSNYANLPTEILIKILNYLSPMDINNTSLTCRRWLEASQYPEFRKKLCLNFIKVHFADHTKPVIDFLTSFREFPCIKFDQVDFGQDEDKFWLKFGEQIQELQLTSCDMREKKFNGILRKLPNLQMLTIEKCRELFMSGRLFEKKKNSNDGQYLIESNLANLLSLNITYNRYLTDAILQRIIMMTPKLKHLNLSGCHISFHKGLYLKFYPHPNIGISESVLTFHYISQYIENADNLISLNFSETLIDGTALTALADMNKLKLERLELVYCDQLTNSGIICLVQKQINLLYLDLSMSVRLTDQSLIEICKHLKNLNVLKLRRCRALTNVGIIELVNIKKLQILDISECENICGQGILDGLAKNHNEIIEELNFSALNICENTIIRIAENFPKLKRLNLSFCFNGVTELATQIIFKHLLLLRELNLDYCDKISDAALTGMSMTKIVSDFEQSKLAEGSSTSSSSQNGVNEQNSMSNCMNRLINIKMNNNNNDLNNHVRISLGSKAEDEILNDAKQKKIIMEFCEQDLSQADWSGYSVSRLKGLKILRLTSCNKVSNISLQYNFQLPELIEISFGKCQQISIDGIKELVKNCPSLENVNLSECHSINDKTIELITKNLKNLQHLYLERCVQLTDFSLDYITIYCTKIKTIDVRGCRSMCNEPTLRLQNISTLRNIYCSKPGPYMSSMTPDSKKPRPPPLPY